MSRLGKLPIKLPKSVSIQIEKGNVLVKGPKGQLSKPLPNFLTLEVSADSVVVRPTQELCGKFEKAMWGTMRAHIANMIHGVSSGWEKNLEISGIGYGFKVTNRMLQVSCGYSHEILLSIPEGVDCSVDKNVLKVVGIDKELVGNFASRVVSVRKADVYLGKGIKYVGQTIRRKAGKSVKK
ncbi:MAG: 50S ribosomal protein L6 [Deltaproteobacteria bacterium]|nr:50S ribosomal protein L6 [Deltaproteobacteria bacterium]